MACDLFSLATTGVAGLEPYQPGKPIEELERELGRTDVVKLASNENPQGPSPAVMAAVAGYTELSRYPDGTGTALKRVLAEKLNVAPEQITLGNGSNDVLEIVTRAFVTPAHEVIYSRHSFAVYPVVTQAVGAKHVVIEAQNWTHDLPAIQAAVTDRTRLIFIANPNNPTGTWLESTALRSFLEALPEHVLVLVDEAYFDYAVVEPGYPDCSTWLADFPNLIVTRTFSKAHGLAGLRIGYALSHPDIADLLNRVRQPFNNNGPALRAAEIAIQDEDYIKESVSLNERGMRQLTAAFEQLGLAFIPSVGNFVCVEFDRPAAPIYEALLVAGIIVRPVANYDMPNHLRISVGLEEENAALIRALGEVL